MWRGWKSKVFSRWVYIFILLYIVSSSKYLVFFYIFKFTNRRIHFHFLLYIYIYIYIYACLVKDHGLFSFQIFECICVSLLVIFLMCGSRWWRKCPILAKALSTISLVILKGWVRFAAVSFIEIHLECFFFFGLLRWVWLILFE